MLIKYRTHFEDLGHILIIHMKYLAPLVISTTFTQVEALSLTNFQVYNQGFLGPIHLEVQWLLLKI